MSFPANTPPACTVDGCGRHAFRTGLCRTHYRRGATHTPRHWGDKRRAFHEAVLSYADATDDAECERAWQRVYKAAKRLFAAEPGQLARGP